MFDALTATWKELCKVHGRSCKKLTEIPNCAANGFVEMGVGRQSRRAEYIGEIVKCWYRMTSLDQEKKKKKTA
jgi:hypothetical protein